jgi:hypothetical protein
LRKLNAVRHKAPTIIFESRWFRTLKTFVCRSSSLRSLLENRTHKLFIDVALTLTPVDYPRM